MVKVNPRPDPGWCACGYPLHYTSPIVQAIVERYIATLGPDLSVQCGDRTWLVPRHYLALHGLDGRLIHSLGFLEVRR